MAGKDEAGEQEQIIESSQNGDKSYLSFKSGYGKKNARKVFAESKMGLGLNHAYKSYERENPGDHARPCEGVDKTTPVNFDSCLKSMERLLTSRDKAEDGQLNGQNSVPTVPDTYYLSGYFYDYTVHMGLRSHLTVEQLESTAKYACENFTESMIEKVLTLGAFSEGTDLFSFFDANSLPQTSETRVVTSVSDYKYSGSIQSVSTKQFCGKLTYMVSLLKHFGLQPHHNLAIIKSFKPEGHTFPATWTAGYAYGKANQYDITQLGDNAE